VADALRQPGSLPVLVVNLKTLSPTAFEVTQQGAVLDSSGHPSALACGSATYRIRKVGAKWGCGEVKGALPVPAVPEIPGTSEPPGSGGVGLRDLLRARRVDASSNGGSPSKPSSPW
jgi:hypothetical protein